MSSSEVVVIGGGCVGASTAFHLAAAGLPDVLLLEADVLAAGSTSKAAGGVRMQHSDELNTRLALRSLAEFTGFEELTGTDLSFKQVGYLFLLDSQDDYDLFAAAGTAQRDLDIPVELLSAEQARDRIPQLDIDGLVGASYCPLDGIATPEALVQGYAAAARRLGVRIRQHARVDRITTRDGRVTGVDVAGEHIAARAVVCAAGTGSRAIAATAGLVLPVHGEPRRVLYSSADAGIPDGIPLTVDFSTGFYFHREGPGLVLGGRDLELERLLAPAVRRVPALGDVPVTSSWCGDYDMSPDENGLVGEAERVRNLFYATGFSGHGFMLSPAVGEHLAELVTGRRPTIDLSPFGVERFDRAGGQRREAITI